MKTKMYLFAAVVAASTFTAATLVAKQPSKPPKARGTDILHWAVRATMTNDGVVPNASGWVQASQNQQGKANNQQLRLEVRSLAANTAYQLYLLPGGDTNYAHATDFTTDTNGDASLRYLKVGSSNGKGIGRTKWALPDALNPVSDISALAVADVNTQAVLTADLMAPDKLQYLVKRLLFQNNVVADLRLKATETQMQFTFYTWGLTPGANYFLALNGAPVSNGIADTNGNLSFTNLPIAVSDILDVQTLAVWDSVSNSVISTQLP